ncbi:hypothetical protein DID78_06665 [Candidatus Marinamargulisbacteria bacterium SCGC AG-343-D04]|nr:hypothetical protein DID78_06665 [Candidatus Marinamargulisbacteria bacterium SCGC AG-343-D04]
MSICCHRNRINPEKIPPNRNQKEIAIKQFKKYFEKGVHNPDLSINKLLNLYFEKNNNVAGFLLLTLLKLEKPIHRNSIDLLNELIDKIIVPDISLGELGLSSYAYQD